MKIYPVKGSTRKLVDFEDDQLIILVALYMHDIGVLTLHDTQELIYFEKHGEKRPPNVIYLLPRGDV